jgi:D-inositol-3-phosphate glycosyltransferase
VAIVSYHTSPLASLGSSAAGGMNVYVRRLAEGLADRGVEVDIFTRRDSIDAPKELEFTPGARVMTVRAGPPRHLSKAQLAGYAPSFAHSLSRLSHATNRRYDIIHSHYWLSGLAGQTLRTADQPLVHMFHTLSRVKQHYQPDAGRGDPPSRDYGERTLLKSKHTLVFSTDAEVEDVERMYGFRPSSVAIIPPGVDGDRFAPRPAEDARKILGLRPGPLVLFVGRMDRAKGVDFLLEAAALLRQGGGWQDLQVVVVGGDDHNRDAVARSELDRLNVIVRDLGLENTVAFRGVVPQEQLPLYYAACDLCAVPSRYESFGMVALEAMSSGRPVVGFRCRGLEQTVRDGRMGFLVDSGDVEALAGAMGRVLSDHCLGCRMGIAARESVKGFSWHRVADSTIGLYTSLVEESTETRSALRSS